jgi:serine/threonine-protein kinase HipA
MADGSIFHAVIADCEPDGWGRQIIRRDHVRRRQEARDPGEEGGARAFNSLDFLLAVDDASRVGALRFRDENGTFQRVPEPGRRAIPPLIELGALLASSRGVETHRETAADLAYLRGCGTSLGGLRPKCSVIDEDGQLAIGKFPSVLDEHAVMKGEVLALHLARDAGITAAEARLVDCSGSPVALVRRFDRDGSRRILFVSSATLLGVERRDGEDQTTPTRKSSMPSGSIARMHKPISTNSGVASRSPCSSPTPTTICSTTDFSMRAESYGACRPRLT